MPVYKEISAEIRECHVAERLEVSLVQSSENVLEMRPRVFFNVHLERLVDGEYTKLTEPRMDVEKPLILDPSTDPDLAAAIELIQLKIGVARYEKLHAPPEPELPNDGFAG